MQQTLMVITIELMIKERSDSLFEIALSLFPGGVNSPVRAFQSVYGNPVFVERGDGSYIWDEDGNKYIDFCCSWGPLILGHNNNSVKSAVSKAIEKGLSFGTPTMKENELASLVLKNNNYLDKIRFVNSGTEAVMSAIRLARGFTKRDKIIKFDGCYHGHADSLLVKAGSGLATFGVSSSEGVPESTANETIVLDLNDKETVNEAFTNYPNEIACIIIEPIPANNGLLIQDQEYLIFLREACNNNGALLIFDEVISGFRLGFGGAAAFYDIQPDLITYGKIIGGGLPVGAYGGKEEIMAHISPDGNVYQAGTLSGNPIAMAAGIAQITACLVKGFYSTLDSRAAHFVEIIRAHIKEKGYKMSVYSIGSIFWIAFSDKKRIQKASDIDADSMELFKIMHSYLLEHGVYLGPSGYEVGFISQAHDQKTLEIAAKTICNSLDHIFDEKQKNQERI